MANRTQTAERPQTEPQPSTALVAAENREIRFKPLAESEEITLTITIVMNTIAVPTKQGHRPQVRDCINFMMLCKARGLNPFVGDAFLIGYDSKDGPTFTLITAIQSLRKRAEANPNFDGCRRGIIVKDKAGEITEREGSFRHDDELLLGGWAEAFRKDHKAPYRETVKLATYNQQRSRWNIDPEGMISKISEASTLRRAFPSDVAGLYLAEEFEGQRERTPAANGNGASHAAMTTAAKLADLAGRAEPGATGERKSPDESHREGQEAVATGKLKPIADPQQSAAPESNALKLGEYMVQLSKAMKVSDVEACMILAKADKELTDGDYDALNERAQQVVDFIAADAEAAG